jgi:hypothetical protein
MFKRVMGIVAALIVLSASAALAATDIRDDFNRANGMLAGSTTSVGGATWVVKTFSAPVRGDWRIVSNKVAWVPSGNDDTVITEAWVASGTSAQFKAEVDLTMSAGTTNNGLVLFRKDESNNVFCKAERTLGRPDGLMSIGKNDDAGDNSLLAFYEFSGAAGDELTPSTTYHLACRRTVNDHIIFKISGGDLSAPQEVNYTMTAAEITKFGGNGKHGLRTKYWVNQGNDNEDDGGSRLDNFSICAPTPC